LLEAKEFEIDELPSLMQNQLSDLTKALFIPEEHKNPNFNGKLALKAADS